MSKTENKENRFTGMPRTRSVFQATARKSGNSTVITVPGEVAEAMQIQGRRVRILIEDNESDTSPKHLFFNSEDGTKSIGIWADGDMIAYDVEKDFEAPIPLDSPEYFDRVWAFLREESKKNVLKVSDKEETT